jgi:ABC-type transport system involved in cytochrome c biogenesis permease subunit
MFSDLGPEEARQLITIFSLLIPAGLYGMGMMEGRSSHRWFLAGMALHGLTILHRASVLKAVPLTEKHDNISFLAFVLALLTWQYLRRRGVQELTVTAVPLVSVLTLTALLFPPIDTVSPFMRTPWFTLHMFLFFAGYGYFGISACLGVVYVRGGGVDAEALQHRTAAQGWTLYTASLVAGSIWFFLAYGTYWLWTSRELWTTLVWFFYGMYLHQRYIRGIAGITASVAGIAGFLVALFAYFGVGTVIPAPPVQF